MKVTMRARLDAMKREQADVPEDKRSWFRIENAAITNAAAEIYLYDEIGMWGVSAADFVNALRQVASPRINLHVNSPGGDVFDGVAIYNALRNHPSRVVGYVDGLAASAASFIIQAAAEVICEPSGTLMIHNAQGIAMGDSTAMRELADLLDKLSGTIADIYTARAGGTQAEWLSRMAAVSWYNATEAVAAGLVDRVAGVKDLPAEADGAEQVDIEPAAAMAEAKAWWRASVHGRAAETPLPDVPMAEGVINTRSEPIPADDWAGLIDLFPATSATDRWLDLFDAPKGV